MAIAPGIQLDPLIAEARRRARRRRLALLAIALAGAGAGIGAWRSTAGAPPPSSPAHEARIAAVARRATIVEAGLTGGVGWAMNGLGLWITRDDGRSWLASVPKDVRTIGDPVARIVQIEFVDQTHGWVAAADVYGGFPIPRGSPSLRHMEIDRTADGGRTWQASVPPGCLQTCGAAYLSFLDRRHGFAAAANRLFATSDGGATWRRVASVPFTGAIAFLDPRRGFGVSDPTRWTGSQQSVAQGGGRLFRTGDGGLSWSRVPVPGTVDTVTFFGRDGVMPVRVREARAHRQRLIVYVTSDGGASWRPRPAPRSLRLPDQNWALPQAWYFSAAAPQVWVATDRRTLFATDAAGRSWRVIRPLDLPRGATLRQLDFASAQEGWAIVGMPKPADGAALVRTTDGGLTWEPLAPPVPKLPLLPKPKPVCGSSCRRP